MNDKKLAKLCHLTWFHQQNKHYLDDDEENIREKTNQLLSNTSRKATTRKGIADTLGVTFSANSSINNSICNIPIIYGCVK